MQKQKQKCILTQTIMGIAGWKILTKDRRTAIFKIKTIISLLIICILSALMGSTAQGIVDQPYEITYKAPRYLPTNPDKAFLSVEEQIRQIADENGFQWTDWLVRLAMCESSLNQYAELDNGAYGLDRGVFQINNHYHPEVSDECAYDIRCATEWTMWRVESGYQHEWVCNSKI